MPLYRALSWVLDRIEARTHADKDVRGKSMYRVQTDRQNSKTEEKNTSYKNKQAEIRIYLNLKMVCLLCFKKKLLRINFLLACMMSITQTVRRKLPGSGNCSVCSMWSKVCGQKLTIRFIWHCWTSHSRAMNSNSLYTSGRFKTNLREIVPVYLMLRVSRGINVSTWQNSLTSLSLLTNLYCWRNAFRYCRCCSLSPKPTFIKCDLSHLALRKAIIVLLKLLTHAHPW